MVSYAAGVSEIKFKPFLIISALGRLPGMIGCLLMGNMMMDENYAGAIVIGFFAVAAFCICIAFRKKYRYFWIGFTRKSQNKTLKRVKNCLSMNHRQNL